MTTPGGFYGGPDCPCCGGLMWGAGVHEDDRCTCSGDRDDRGICDRHRAEREEDEG